MKLKLLKPVRIEGESHPAGTVLDVTTKALAAQLIVAGQATDNKKAVKDAEDAAKKKPAGDDDK